MYLSKLFIPIIKDIPTEAKIKSHQLMLRTGMIKQSSAGIYSWLPLGFKVMKKIEQIVREEQNLIGAQEMLMPTIQSSDIWKESGRYEDYGEEMLRIKDRQGREMLYGPTNEELITDIFRSSIKSYKSLPQILYHIQWKFRDEIRPRFGVMRCRDRRVHWKAGADWLLEHLLDGEPASNHLSWQRAASCFSHPP